MVFVQSHSDSDSDEDIRDDLRRQRNLKFHVVDLFFVDSKRAMEEQNYGVRSTDDLARLIDLLQRELPAA